MGFALIKGVTFGLQGTPPGCGSGSCEQPRENFDSKSVIKGKKKWAVHSFHYSDSLQLVLGFYYPAKSKRNIWREQDYDRSTSAEVLE